MNREDKIIDKTETVAEELKIFFDLKVRVVSKGIIEIDTIAGRMKYSVNKESVMHNVYRFIQHYGGKLHKWGIEKAVEELNNTK